MSNLFIEYHCLSDDKMRELGFSDYVKGKWYYCSHVSEDVNNIGDKGSITFNITIKKDGSGGDILVLDENYLQPYDYEQVLAYNPNSVFTQKVKANVEKIMFSLQQAGVISGWKFGDKI